MRTLVALLCALLVPSLGWSNPVPLGGPGRTLAPRYVKDADRIALREETVVLTDGLSVPLPSFAPRAPPMDTAAVGYVGTYVLENLSEKPAKITIGFPVAEGGTRAGQSYGALAGFEVQVGGRPVAAVEEEGVELSVLTRGDLLEKGVSAETLALLAREKLVVPVEGDPGLLDLRPLGAKPAVVRARLKRLASLESEQRALVEASALKRLGGEDDFILDARLAWRSFPVRFAPREKLTVRISYTSIRSWPSMPYSFAYILTTGARWSGKIGRCRVEIVPAKGRAPADYRVSPAGAKVEEGRLVLEWRDFEPAQDVVVQVAEP